MTLVQAPRLGIDRFANDRNQESRAQASDGDKSTIIRAVYQQVLGYQYVMSNERLSAAESLFRNGFLSVRELVRTVAKSGLYRSRFFENCNPYRFIELNHKHLLGRAPQNKAEMLHHFTILQEQGYDAEIDSYIDSAEYQERFGQEVVPYLHGWDYSKGHEGRQFSWLMQLARGASASAKGDGSGTQFRLGKALHQDRALPVVGSPGRVLIVSTEGPFRALMSSSADISTEYETGTARRAPSQTHREQALRVSAGNRGTSGSSGRLVTLSVTGLADNDYVRSGAYVLRVPYTRMNETMRQINRMGGRITNVTVS